MPGSRARAPARSPAVARAGGPRSRCSRSAACTAPGSRCDECPGLEGGLATGHSVTPQSQRHPDQARRASASAEDCRGALKRPDISTALRPLTARQCANPTSRMIESDHTVHRFARSRNGDASPSSARVPSPAQGRPWQRCRGQYGRRRIVALACACCSALLASCAPTGGISTARDAPCRSARRRHRSGAPVPQAPVRSP